MSEQQAPSGPRRPATIEFLRIKRPGRPVVLKWDTPFGEVAGYRVYATENKFPPQMAGALFAGQMRQFVDEEELEPTATELRIARADNYYAVISFDEDDNYTVVGHLREPDEDQEVLVDISAYVGTQSRTSTRVKYVPGVVAMRDREVHVYVRDVEPNKTTLNKMATGELPPDYRLKPEGDGFIDTVSEDEWRKFYVVVAVGKDGVRRPQNLELGGFVRLEDPQYLDPRGGKQKTDKLIEAVRDQLELELQRRSVTVDDFRAMLARADKLAPFHPMIARLRQKARDRFGEDV